MILAYSGLLLFVSEMPSSIATPQCGAPIAVGRPVQLPLDPDNFRNKYSASNMNGSATPSAAVLKRFAYQQTARVGTATNTSQQATRRTASFVSVLNGPAERLISDPSG